MAAAAAAMAVPPMPTKWTDLSCVENIPVKLPANPPGHKQFCLTLRGFPASVEHNY
jgi:hypothetical protein